MAAADEQLLGAGAPGAKLGPYWRRKTGTTLPGERTGAQLQRINILRRALGLPVEGGRIGDANAGEGAGPGGNPAGMPTLPPFLAAAQARSAPIGDEGAGPGGNPAGDPASQWRTILQTLHGEANPGHPLPAAAGGMTREALGEGQGVDPGFNHGDVGNDPRAAILRRLTGGQLSPAATSRQALQHHVMKLMQRQGRPNILPNRRPIPAGGSQGAGPGGVPY